jgi:hypothetical protein
MGRIFVRIIFLVAHIAPFPAAKLLAAGRISVLAINVLYNQN